MKSISRLLLILLLLQTAACKKNEARNNDNEIVKDDIVHETKDIISKAESTGNQIDVLEETTPMSQKDYQDWLPKVILDLPLKSSSEKNNAEIPQQGILAIYESEDKKIELRITDMVGEQASLFPVFLNTIGKERNNRESGSYYKKAVKKQGYVANEIYEKGSNPYSFLRFIHNDRYLVNIKANGFTPDDLWEHLNEFKLKNLQLE